jgi:hypothetical protein
MIRSRIASAAIRMCPKRVAARPICLGDALRIRPGTVIETALAPAHGVPSEDLSETMMLRVQRSASSNRPAMMTVIMTIAPTARQPIGGLSGPTLRKPIQSPSMRRLSDRPGACDWVKAFTCVFSKVSVDIKVNALSCGDLFGTPKEILIHRAAWTGAHTLVRERQRDIPHATANCRLGQGPIDDVALRVTTANTPEIETHRL